jgi:glycosyltransferase involved in cell wall biosynthesis
MNICLASDTYLPRVNGVVRSVQSFAEQFRKQGHRVWIFAPAFPDYKDLEPDVVRFPSRYVFFDPEDRLANMSARGSKELVKHFAEYKFDIVHNQAPFALGLASVKWGKAHHIPLVSTYHTLFEAYVHNYLKAIPDFVGRWAAARFSSWFCNQHDLIIAPSSPMADALKAYGVTVPVAINATGIDLAPFQNLNGQRMREKLGFAKDDIMLLTMGRVAREKNLPFLLDVMERLAPLQPKARLVIAGQGPALEEIKALVTKRKLDSKIVYIGYLNRQDWADLYAAAELDLLASVTETQGMVLTEAMAAGTPCVAVGAMGVKDVMADGGGLMVGLDQNEFTQAVNRMLTDKNLYAQKLKEAKAQAQAWSIQAKAKELLEKYQKLIETYKAKRK